LRRSRICTAVAGSLGRQYQGMSGHHGGML
jgi:hypothetical protein